MEQESTTVNISQKICEFRERKYLTLLGMRKFVKFKQGCCQLPWSPHSIMQILGSGQHPIYDLGLS